MKRAGIRALVVALALACAESAAGEPQVSAPRSAAPGSPLACEIDDSADITGAYGVLSGAGGTRLSEARAFPLALPGGRVGWVVLLAVPNTLSPGAYDLRFGVREPRGVVRIARTLDVLPRTFVHETIRLNGSLTALIERYDPVKAAQARQLAGILAAFNPGDVYDAGPFALPVANFVETAHFGDRRTYLFDDGKTLPDIHEGVDLAVPLGTPVRAAGAGKVAFAGDWIVTGNTVVIEHLPGFYTLYFHLSRLLVATGAMVSRGEEIGLVGQTGLATGPHVHWEARIQGVAVDPRLLLEAPLIDKSAMLGRMETQSP